MSSRTNEDDSQRTSVEERVEKKYGVTDCEFEDLTIKEDTKINAAANPENFVHLVPESIDNVKDWIGVKNEDAPSCCELERDLPSEVIIAEIREEIPSADHAEDALFVRDTDLLSDFGIEADLRTHIGTAINQYVYGNSEDVVTWKPLLDELITKGHFPHRDILLSPIFELRIESGSTYEVAGLDVLAADSIVIERNAKIVTNGNLKIDTGSIEGEV